jgi:hypothetical protein
MIPKEDQADAMPNPAEDAVTLGRKGSTPPLLARPVRSRIFSQIRKVLRILGPGIVTGAADDDPSGIATYSQVGAQFGFSMLWTMLFIYPFMAGIQEISARLGRVTGHGIAGNMRCFYSRWLLYSIGPGVGSPDAEASHTRQGSPF